MPFAISIRRWFAASHQLRLHDGSLEPLHGHNWRVRLTAARADGGLDEIGTVHDFHDLERHLDEALRQLHNAHLNDLPAFARLNPTTENVAAHLAVQLELSSGLRIIEVEVWETPDCSATFRP
jgi:6-pyruvoyltetrahydropterin/6-carboxytetrahydropterin synthase